MDTVTGNGNDLDFDANGNTIIDEDQDTYSYDGWNRLASFDATGSDPDATYAYDALGRRIVEDPSNAAARDLFYSLSWQVIEERESGTVKAQNVWGLGHVDALVLREGLLRSQGGAEGFGTQLKELAGSEKPEAVVVLVHATFELPVHGSGANPLREGTAPKWVAARRLSEFVNDRDFRSLVVRYAAAVAVDPSGPAAEKTKSELLRWVIEHHDKLRWNAQLSAFEIPAHQ